MATIIFSVLGENVIIDSKTNLASAINIIENINTPTLPTIFPLAHLLMLWEKSIALEGQIESFQIRIRLKVNEIFMEKIFEIPVSIPADTKRMRSVVRVEGLPIPHEGLLTIIIEKKERDEWIEVSKIPINIIKTS